MGIGGMIFMAICGAALELFLQINFGINEKLIPILFF